MVGFKGVKIAAFLIVLTGLAWAAPTSAIASECTSCHTDADTLKDFTEGMSKYEAGIDRIFVGKAFFDDENHGSMSCEECHKGNPDAMDVEEAHQGLILDPSYPAPGICADCHDNPNYESSAHYKGLGGGEGKDAQCVATCGECHLSRPSESGGGLVRGHEFMTVPTMANACNACHADLGKEYTGLRFNRPDAHYAGSEMQCAECHTGKQLHGDEPASAAACLNCHQDVYDANSKFKGVHTMHKGRLSCQVCHAQPYIGGEACNPAETQPEPYFKAALNPNPTDANPDKFVMARKTGNKWVPYVPHTIARKTPQAADCNACHGFENRKLFLTLADVPVEDRETNRALIVPPERIPAPIAPAAE